MSKNHKNRARKVLSTILASVGLVYLGVTVIVRGTNEADEVSGIIAGFALVLTTLGLLKARGEPPPRARKSGREPGREPRAEVVTGPPISLTTTGAYALANALGFPASRPSCEPQPGTPDCARLINPRPFAAPAPCGRRNGPVVVVVLDRPHCGSHP
ncbi:hypothetical protein [Nonomuraea sp. NPDC048826]|uniref:hypothetical protein n=1 Tax=Nonomuraea sp. NPDC048826 TaxID=3364347 RepID=UPI0037236B29